MENLNELKFFEVERPRIPSVLIRATIDSMKDSAASRNMDYEGGNFARGLRQSIPTNALNSHHSDGRSTGNALKKRNVPESVLRHHKHHHKKKHVIFEEDEDSEADTVHRSHGDRRMAFLITGDQHRFQKHGDRASSDFLYLQAPPVDFSFALLSSVEEITAAQETPNKKRNYKFPEKTEDDRYKTSSVRLSYNLLENIYGLVSLLYKILDGGPAGLCWIDLSFNHITSLDEDTLQQIPNVRIMYLHGNLLADMWEIIKLKNLTQLYTLTLHGNPIEEADGYRPCVLHYLPNLKHLDYFSVTKSDKANASHFGRIYEPVWNRRHGELENQAKIVQAAQDISFTEKVMKEEDEDVEA